LIEAETSERIGAGRYEIATRVTDRNGARPSFLSTQTGDVQLRVPKLRKRPFFPVILEPRRRKALCAVVIEAYVNGVSARSVEDLVVALASIRALQVGGLPHLRQAQPDDLLHNFELSGAR
jgi:putative transposase